MTRIWHWTVECSHETGLAAEITNVTVQTRNSFCVGHLIRVMLSPPHRTDILQAPGKTKQLGASDIGALERLIAGLERKCDEYPDIIRCW